MHLWFIRPLCIMLFMRAAFITRASGRELGPGNRDFFGPCEMASNRYANLQILSQLRPRIPPLYSNRLTGVMEVRGNIVGYTVTWKLEIQKTKITWRLNGFPFSVLHGKHCGTYGNIIKMKHQCSTTTTFCDTSTIKIFIILWNFQDVIHTLTNSLIN